MSLKKKAISGFTWSFSENIVTSIANFLIGIVLARLLFPKDFGLVGLAFAFLSFVTVFTDAGFGVALLQKKDTTEDDYSSVFFLNLFFATLLYLILYLSASLLADFFKEPGFTSIIRVAGLTIIINALATIQNVILSKKVDFKTLTIVAVSSTVVSGVAAVVLAFFDFGVWALVYRALLQSIISIILFFYFSSWRPSFIFHFASIRSLFGFGSKLLLGNLLDKLFQNAFYFVIGKVYSPIQLGQYSRADMFSKIPSQNLLGVVQKVSFPILVELRDDPDKLQSGYRTLIQNTMFISFLAMFCLAAAAESIVILLIGEVWRPSIVYLQLLCFSSVLFPLHALNLNMITVHGRSDITLRLEVWKKLLLVPVIVLGVYHSIEWMLCGMIIFSIMAYFLNASYASRFVNYSIINQCTDLMPGFLLAFMVGFLIFSISFLSFDSYLVIFAIQASIAIVGSIVIGELAKVKPYQDIKTILLNRFFGKK